MMFRYFLKTSLYKYITIILGNLFSDQFRFALDNIEYIRLELLFRYYIALFPLLETHYCCCRGSKRSSGCL